MPYRHRWPRPCALLLLWISCSCLPAQTVERCDGNLGENIFTEGDFGRGLPNIPATDPGLSPGLTYQRNPPPNDGFYTITNSTARSQWPRLFPTWLEIGDNSSDPLGYMMVVNASFQPSVFYAQEVDGLCGNTTYEFTADIINITRRGSNNLLPNVSFFIGEEEFYETGPIAETDAWATYGFTFRTEPGQESVRLSLRNNAPGGRGNDLALDNIAFRPCGPGARIVARGDTVLCEGNGPPLLLEAAIDGDQYPTPTARWQRSPDGRSDWADVPGATGLSYRHDDLRPGRYFYRYLLANGPENLDNPKCRIVSNVAGLRVLPGRVNLTDTICAGLPYPFGGRQLTTGGSYLDSLVSARGCDSIVELELTVVPDPGLRLNATATDPSCHNDTDGSIRLGAPPRGTPPFRLSDPATGAAVTDSLLAGLGGGFYPFRLTDRYGCSVTDTVELTNPPPFELAIQGVTLLRLGDETILRVAASEAITDYRWLPESVVRCGPDCGTVRAAPTGDTTLFLLATNAAGCTQADSVALTIYPERRLFLPSAFSPNEDGVNDHFFVGGAVPNVTRVVSLRIFNRWGAEVFAARDVPPNTFNAGWDGMLNGEPAEAGVYPFVAEVLFRDGIVERYTGAVTLVR